MKIALASLFLFIVVPTMAQDVASIDWNDEPIDDKAILSKLFELYYAGEVTVKDIHSLEKVSSKDGILLLRGRLDDDLPEVVEKPFIVVALDKKVIIFSLDFAEILAKTGKSSCLIGGIQHYRGLGYYYVYNFSGTTLQQIFKSDVPVYNNGIGCESYEGGRLNFKFEDINHDGSKDLYFQGTKNIYCDGRASDRKNDVIMKKEEVVLDYIFDQKAYRFVKIER